MSDTEGVCGRCGAILERMEHQAPCNLGPTSGRLRRRLSEWEAYYEALGTAMEDSLVKAIEEAQE